MKSSSSSVIRVDKATFSAYEKSMLIRDFAGKDFDLVGIYPKIIFPASGILVENKTDSD